MKPRSWMILILAIGIISLAIGLVLGYNDIIVAQFNISPFDVEALEKFLRQYVTGIPIPLP